MAVYLAYPGIQDMFLTEEPDFTYFKTIYKRNLQSETRVVEQPFDQTSYRPGDTLIATLKQNGDYLMNVSLKLQLPAITPTNSTYWVYPNYLDFVEKSASFFFSNGVPIYTLTLNGLLVTTKNNYWFNGGDPSYVTISGDKFVFFTNGASDCYVIFDDINTAHLFGFVYNPIQLFGGYVRFKLTSSNQVTFQECGWLKGDRIYDSTYSYLDDTVYKIVNSVSLYIGKTLIQEVDSSMLKFLEYTDVSFKNKPCLKLLDGNDSIVNFNRIYYFSLPFLEIPIHAMSRHDVQVRVKINPLNYFNFYASLILRYDSFGTQNLPKKYSIPVSQFSYFPGTNGRIDIRGPVKRLVLKNSTDFKLLVNGEEYANKNTIVPNVYENLVNTPPSETSNIVVFNNPINMSRINDQKVPPGQDVYSETLNILTVMNDLSGLLFDSSQTSDSYPIVIGNITNPLVASETYLFDSIPKTASTLDCFYSMRIVSPVYSGPVVRIRNSDTGEEADFYTDTTQSFLKTSDGISIEDFGTNLRISIWYDQSLNKNNLTQTITQFQPYLVKDGVIGKYTVGILNDTSDNDSVSPTCWMDITNPVHSQQFLMSVNLNYIGTTATSSIFSTKTIMFRITNGSLIGDNTTGDWVKWPNSGGGIFTVNGVSSNTVSISNWSAITGYQSNVYSGPDISIIGIPGPGDLQIPIRSMNGYFYELGFMRGTSMSQEYDDYYQNSIIYKKYPMDNISSFALASLNGAYSIKSVFSTYTGPVVQIRRSSDSAIIDFYSDADTNGNLNTSSGVDYISWLNGATGYVTIWYDQSGKGYHAQQSNVAIQPTVDYTNKVVDFTANGGLSYLQTTPGLVPMKYTYTVCTKHGVIGNLGGGLLGSGQQSTNKANNFRRDGSTYNNYWWFNDLNGGSYTDDSIVSWVFGTKGTSQAQTSGTTLLYVNGSNQTSGFRSGWNGTYGTYDYIGSTILTGSETLNGTMSFLTVFKAALSDTDRGIVESQ